MINIPNKFIIFRTALTLPIILLFYINTFYSVLIATILLLLAVMADRLDRYLVKKYRQITHFGRMMDPIANKVLFDAILIYFVWVSIIPFWTVLILINTDLIIYSLRIVVSYERRISIIISSRLNCIAQRLKIYSILFTGLIVLTNLQIRDINPDISLYYKVLLSKINLLPNFFLCITAIFSLIAVVNHVYKNRQFIKMS